MKKKYNNKDKFNKYFDVIPPSAAEIEKKLKLRGKKNGCKSTN